MQETWAQFLGQEDPLEKEIATHSSILAWDKKGSLMDYSPWDCKRVRHNLATEQQQQYSVWWYHSLILSRISSKTNARCSLPSIGLIWKNVCSDLLSTVFLIGLSIFLLLSFESLLYSLDISAFSDICLAKFSPSLRFVCSFSQKAEVLLLIKFNLSICFS